jgi:cation diffusion facilitator family transporter
MRCSEYWRAMLSAFPQRNAGAAVQNLNAYAAGGLAVAVVVLAAKGAAYAVTGSVALLSDALESIINVTVALLTVVTLRVAQRPPDANHPFGHGKAEYLSAVAEGALIIAVSVLIFAEAYMHAINPQPFTMPTLGVALNAGASVVNAVWGWYLLRVGKRFRSPALIADARHVIADVVSSAAVVAGVVLAAVTNRPVLDAAVAALAGVYILWSGWQLMQDSVGGLMDQAADPETQAAIRSCISKEAEGALEAHDVQTRYAGRATFIQFHLVVPATMTVSDAHDICDRVEQRLKEIVPGASVTIHVEPENKAKHEGVVVV